MEDLTVTRSMCKEIRQHARDIIGGFGMRLELAERWNGEKGGDTYFNCLTPGDDDGGDLYDTVPFKTLHRLSFEPVNGRVLLDFYVYDTEQLRSNLMVEFDATGLCAVFEPSYTPDAIMWFREGYTWSERMLKAYPRIKPPINRTL